MTRTASILATTALAALLAACGGSKTGTAGLSVSVRSAPTAGKASPAGLSAPKGVTLSRVRMAVRRVSVEGDDAAAACEPLPVTTTTPAPAPLRAMKDGGSSGGGADDALPDHGAQRENDECELAFGPFDVDVAGSALSGGVDFAFSAPIPAGTYEEVAITVNTVPAERAAGNPVLEALAAAHASILVDGFVQEASSTTTTPTRFTFSAPMRVRQAREGAFVLGPKTNVTLTFDPSRWFVSSTGALLDPRDPTAEGAILANIRASLRLVRDDDRDGLDDDHR